MPADKCYIVLFESPANQTGLIEAIKSYGTWGKLNSNAWAIVTKKNSVEVRNHLLKFVGLAGRLFVVKSGVEAAWSNVLATNDWLKKNI